MAGRLICETVLPSAALTIRRKMSFLPSKASRASG